MGSLFETTPACLAYSAVRGACDNGPSFPGSLADTCYRDIWHFLFFFDRLSFLTNPLSRNIALYILQT